jgi:alpha-L-fucosidase
MQERLIQMGKWLKANGEAIYGTEKWIKPVQWSQGNRDFKPKEKAYLGGDYIIKQTINPEPGYAVKEIFFSYKSNNLFAICPKWPGKQLVIKDIKAANQSKVHLLATGQSLDWENIGGNLVIDLPEYDPNAFIPEHSYAYVFKISDVEEAN